MRRLLFLPSVVAVSLAGATVYLAQQLGRERERAQQAEARVAELESRLHSVDRERLVERETIVKAPTATVAPASTAPTTAKRSDMLTDAQARVSQQRCRRSGSTRTRLRSGLPCAVASAAACTSLDLYAADIRMH
jgi:hypothetical protein